MFARRTFVLLFILSYTTSAVLAQSYDPGMAAMQMEQWDNAIKIYTERTKANPADQEALLILGNAYLGKGDKVKAKEAFTAAFNAKSEGALAYVSNGRIALLNNDPGVADAQFSKAEKAGKKDINALRSVGESYLYFTPDGAKRPNYARSEELLKNAIAVNAKDFKTLMALGYCYKETPNGGLAAQNYEFASTIEKNNPLPKMMLAKTYQAAKLKDKSLLYLDQAIATDPSFIQAHRMKAEGFYYEKRFEKSKNAYTEMFANTKDYTIDDQMFYANTLYLTKDYKGAIDQVEQIVKKDNSKSYLKRLLGYSYYETGDYAKGMNIMQEYFKTVEPSKVLASDYLYYGRLMIKNGGDTLAAVREMAKAIEKDSSVWPVYKEMGEIYYGKKDYCSAAKAYELYLDSMATPEATDFYKLGICQFYCKDDSLRYQHAQATFTKLTERMPDAGIGWYWRARSEVKMEPDIQVDPTLIPNFGVAKDSYARYSTIASADPVKNRANLIESYEYLVYYHYVRGCAAPFNDVLGKLLALDAANETANGLKTQVETAGMPVSPTGVVCE